MAPSTVAYPPTGSPLFNEYWNVYQDPEFRVDTPWLWFVYLLVLALALTWVRHCCGLGWVWVMERFLLPPLPGLGKTELESDPNTQDAPSQNRTSNMSGSFIGGVLFARAALSARNPLVTVLPFYGHFVLLFIAQVTWLMCRRQADHAGGPLVTTSQLRRLGILTAVLVAVGVVEVITFLSQNPLFITSVDGNIGYIYPRQPQYIIIPPSDEIMLNLGAECLCSVILMLSAEWCNLLLGLVWHSLTTSYVVWKRFGGGDPKKKGRDVPAHHCPFFDVGNVLVCIAQCGVCIYYIVPNLSFSSFEYDPGMLRGMVTIDPMWTYIKPAGRHLFIYCFLCFRPRPSPASTADCVLCLEAVSIGGIASDKEGGGEEEGNPPPRSVVLPCQHAFHVYCLNNSLSVWKPKCPLCTYGIFNRRKNIPKAFTSAGGGASTSTAKEERTENRKRVVTASGNDGDEAATTVPCCPATTMTSEGEGTEEGVRVTEPPRFSTPPLEGDASPPLKHPPTTLPRDSGIAVCLSRSTTPTTQYHSSSSSSGTTTTTTALCSDQPPRLLPALLTAVSTVEENTTSRGRGGGGVLEEATTTHQKGFNPVDSPPAPPVEEEDDVETGDVEDVGVVGRRRARDQATCTYDPDGDLSPPEAKKRRIE